jgi:polyphosphate kinase
MPKKEKLLINRELSWLSFNERVLQEASDPKVPLKERLKFLGIFSNNQDEFFRVRVATNRRLLFMKRGDFDDTANKVEIKSVLKEIQAKVLSMQKKYDTLFFELLESLKIHKVFLVDERQLGMSQQQDVRKFFKSEVLSSLFPIVLDKSNPFPNLSDTSIYLAIRMSKSSNKDIKYALVEIPAKEVGRFFVLPKKDENHFIMFIDDVIRMNLKMLFSTFDYDVFEAYTIKITRDAELDMELDLSENLYEKMKKVLKQRKQGEPVRFIYDKEMPKDLLDFFVNQLKLPAESIIPGKRYHNFKDLMKFPDIGLEGLNYKPIQPVPIPELDAAKSMLNAISKKDYMLSHPYQSFDYVVRFLREAAIDPNVIAIKITLYRVAEKSNVVKALINAVKNGKKVFVMMELKARFDEEANIYWSGKLKEEGANVIFGYPNLKVHSKICMVYRKEGNRIKHYAHVGTGNYNGLTARLYGDQGLFTSNPKITAELNKVFNLIENYNQAKPAFNNLLVAPVNMKSKIISMIEREGENARKGKEAWIKMKVNSLVEKDVIMALYKASSKGVKIQLIVRGICCLIPGKIDLSENIEAISIIDKYLEHSRMFIFANGGKNEYYMGSGDMMTRNLNYRIEVTIPILSPHVQEELLQQFEIQWRDNVKARILDEFQLNKYKAPGLPLIRAQVDYYAYLQTKYLPV